MLPATGSTLGGVTLPQYANRSWLPTVLAGRLTAAVTVFFPAALFAQNCDLPAAGGGAPPPASWSGTAGGHFQGQAITIPPGANMSLSSDLTIIANGDDYAAALA
jgi:hypothetical protein